MTVFIAEWDAMERAKRRPKTRVGKARADAPSERVVQRQIVKAFRAMGIITVHVQNGTMYAGDSLARQKQNAVLIADGVLPGWPDLLCINRAGAVGLLEVKREGGTLSAEQERIAALVGARGLGWAAVCTLDEALAAVKSWGWL